MVIKTDLYINTILVFLWEQMFSVSDPIPCSGVFLGCLVYCLNKHGFINTCVVWGVLQSVC